MRNGNSKNTFAAVQGRVRSLSPKTIAAVALMALMAVLWLRVLLKGSASPSAAQAAETALEVKTSQTDTPATVVPTALPVVEGRNDVLSRDFFSAGGWQGFGRPTARPAAADDDAGRRRLTAFFESLEKSLNLDAILQDGAQSKARACVDGKVLAVGQALTVRNGTDKYELTVSKIDNDRVVLTWDQWTIVLKMARPERVD